ncbi:MAG: tetratricopeptide repeat protein [Erythrobacter sp.]|jgi:tetratricopeptide (TPR) repeat protein|nr:tetratricopeptide repeat protein [Erythrobacter sp.]
MAQGELAEAGRLLDEARAIGPEDPGLWVAIARLRFRGGEHLTALEAADRALALGPDHAPALLMRALMVRDAHGFVDALPWFEAALAADRTNADAWAEYAATLGDGGRYREMLEAAHELAKVAPDDPRLFYLQAVLAQRGGKPVLARSLLQRSGMTAGGVPAAQLLDALINLDQGNFDSAAAQLEALAARQPANARVRTLLARALFLGGREAELVDQFATDAERPEASPYLVMLVARAYERLGDRGAAAPLLERAFAEASRVPSALARRSGLPQPTAELRTLATAGNWNGARSAARDYRSRFPASADLAQLEGDAALGAGDGQAALAAYAAAARLRRPWPLTRKVLFASRRIGEGLAADTLLARHVAGEPDNIAALFDLARLMGTGADWQRSAMLLDHAIALGGGHDPALLALRAKAAEGLGNDAEAKRFAGLAGELRPPALAARQSQTARHSWR